MGDSEIDFEFERAYDREELAAVFREFAAALREDRPLRLDDGDRTATVSVPPRVVAAFEAERDDDDPPAAELELELEWDDPDGATIGLGDSERDEPGVVGSDLETGGEPETDPATAAMPPEGVPGTDPDGRRGEPSADETDSDGDEATGAAERERGGGRTSRFEVYEDRGGEWRWRLVHWNGNIVADSGEGYTSRSNAKRAARSVMRSAPTARIVDRED